MVASTMTFSLNCAGVFANHRLFQSRMMPMRCAYGCTTCVILFCRAFFRGLGRSDSELQRDNAHDLPQCARPAAPERTCTLQDGSFVDRYLFDKKIFRRDTASARVGECRVQEFSYRGRGLLGQKRECGARLRYRLAADQISNEADLARRLMVVGEECFHKIYLAGAFAGSAAPLAACAAAISAAFAAISASFCMRPPCLTNFVVGANSPRRCPTMSSVTKTSSKFFPVCTRNV